MDIRYFTKPSYVYVIECQDLGLFYIGSRKEQVFETDDAYMGSSDLLNALRAEFHEHDWTKTLVFESTDYQEVLAVETDLILYERESNPNNLINRSANNERVQWEFTATGNVQPADLHRLERAKKQVRSIEVPDGRLMNLVMTKTDGWAAHAPCMPSRDETPKPQYGNWAPDLLKTYISLPPGSYHFACHVQVKPNGKKNYKPFALVESFDSELEAREMSSVFANLQVEQYREYIQAMLG